jgi:hypothetical protein
MTIVDLEIVLILKPDYIEKKIYLLYHINL